MARVGISKSYTAGALTDVTALFGLVKQLIVDAGFNIVTNIADRIEFTPAGTTPAANTSDDTPHFTIYLVGTDQIRARALYGLTWNDGGVKSGAEVTIVDTPIQYSDGTTTYSSAFALRAAADGREGWFWFMGMQSVWDAIQEVEVASYHRAVACTPARRLPSDMSAGRATRYGVFSDAGMFAPAYALNASNAQVAASLGWWSPVCADGAGSAKLTASIGTLSAPIYPSQAANMATALFGELDCVMANTDGFANYGTAIPGWMTFAPELDSAPDLAFKAPSAFTAV